MIGVAEACRVLDVPRSTYSRGHLLPTAVAAAREQPCDQAVPPSSPARSRRCCSPRALSAEERAQIREVLNSERFADASPREVYATLLDEGRYLCSWPTMYRILREAHEVRRRRDQARNAAIASQNC